MARPVDEVVAGAKRYAQNAGLHLPDTDYSRTYTTARAVNAVGHAYDAMPDFDKSAMPAYRQLREETMRQFDHMTGPKSRGGMGIDVEVTRHDPYGENGVHNIVRDFRGDVQQGRMKVLSTASTGGHPVFSNDDNDAFRAVHDVFGHLGSGRGIDMHGEEAAYQKHSRMFSPLARQALATETRGQNAALHLHGDFQEQKVGILPAHMQGLQFNQQAPYHQIRAAIQDAHAEDRKQGL